MSDACGSGVCVQVIHNDAHMQCTNPGSGRQTMKPRGASSGLQEAWEADQHEVAIREILDGTLDLPLLSAHAYHPVWFSFFFALVFLSCSVWFSIFLPHVEGV